MTLTVGSLFSGIGGLDLGLERAGMEVIWQSEIDPYASQVLKKHWPEVPNLGDITTIDWTQVERPDLICGGYPCQPFSFAGNRQGTADARHLWPFFADAIRILRPRYAVLENVPGHLSLGFGDVLGCLSEIGYDAGWSTISARDVGAPHLRERLVVVAYAEGEHCDGPGPSQGEETGRAEEGATELGDCGGSSDELPQSPSSREHGVVSNPVFTRLEGLRSERQLRKSPQEGEVGWARWWSSEPDVGRVAYGVPYYVDRLRGLGNAVVPQVAEVIGRIIVESDTATTSTS